MKANKILMALLAVFAIGIASFSAMAYRGEPSAVGPNYDEEIHSQLEAAMEAGDYDLWVSIREDNNLPMNGKIFSVINEDNFDKFVELHEAMESGDSDTADSIRSELGLGQGMMKRGNGQKNSRGAFVDADNDGNCDNIGAGKAKGSGKGLI